MHELLSSMTQKAFTGITRNLEMLVIAKRLVAVPVKSVVVFMMGKVPHAWSKRRQLDTYDQV